MNFLEGWQPNSLCADERIRLASELRELFGMITMQAEQALVRERKKEEVKAFSPLVLEIAALAGLPGIHRDTALLIAAATLTQLLAEKGRTVDITATAVKAIKELPDL